MPLLITKPTPQTEVRIKILPLPLTTYTKPLPAPTTAVEILSSKTREERRTIDQRSSRRPSHSHSSSLYSTSTSPTSTSTSAPVTWVDDYSSYGGAAKTYPSERCASRDTGASVRSGAGSGRRKSSVVTVDGDFYRERRGSVVGSATGGKKTVLVVRG